MRLTGFFQWDPNIGDRDGMNVEMVLLPDARHFAVCAAASSLVKGLQKKVAR